MLPDFDGNGNVTLLGTIQTGPAGYFYFGGEALDNLVASDTNDEVTFLVTRAPNDSGLWLRSRESGASVSDFLCTKMSHL